MSYRNPNRPRMQSQAGDIFLYAGQTATWRQYVSGSAGVSVAGFGTTPYYAEKLITGLFTLVPVSPEMQTPAGMILSDTFQVTTRERLEQTDVLQWKGEAYRVDSDPSPAVLPGTWMSIVKRGQNT